MDKTLQGYYQALGHVIAMIDAGKEQKIDGDLEGDFSEIVPLTIDDLFEKITKIVGDIHYSDLVLVPKTLTMTMHIAANNVDHRAYIRGYQHGATFEDMWDAAIRAYLEEE